MVKGKPKYKSTKSKSNSSVNISNTNAKSFNDILTSQNESNDEVIIVSHDKDKKKLNKYQLFMKTHKELPYKLRLEKYHELYG